MLGVLLSLVGLLALYYTNNYTYQIVVLAPYHHTLGNLGTHPYARRACIGRPVRGFRGLLLGTQGKLEDPGKYAEGQEVMDKNKERSLTKETDDELRDGHGSFVPR